MGSPEQHMHGVVRVMFLLKPTSSGSEYHRVFTYLAGIDYLYIISIYIEMYNPFLLILNVPLILKTGIHLQFPKISVWPI